MRVVLRDLTSNKYNGREAFVTNANDKGILAIRIDGRTFSVKLHNVQDLFHTSVPWLEIRIEEEALGNGHHHLVSYWFGHVALQLALGPSERWSYGAAR